MEKLNATDLEWLDWAVADRAKDTMQSDPDSWEESDWISLAKFERIAKGAAVAPVLTDAQRFTLGRMVILARENWRLEEITQNDWDVLALFGRLAKGQDV